MLNLPLSEVTFVAFDFETTGLSAACDRVIEIGAVRFQPGQNHLRKRLSQLIQPQMKIPAEVIPVHGIDDAQVSQAPLFTEVAADLLAFMEGAVLLAHHAAFDLAFLTCELRRCQLPVSEWVVLDTFHLSRRLFPQAPGFGLGNLLNFLQIEMSGPAHRALPDAEGCAALFEAALAKIGPLSLGELLAAYPQARVGYSAAGPEQQALQTELEQAIAAQLPLKITYRNSRNEQLERQVQPILLGGYGKYAYLEAFCHLRQANRQFRLERILKIAVTETDPLANPLPPR